MNEFDICELRYNKSIFINSVNIFTKLEIIQYNKFVNFLYKKLL